MWKGSEKTVKGREGKQEKNFGVTVELEVLLSLCYLKPSHEMNLKISRQNPDTFSA